MFFLNWLGRAWTLTIALGLSGVLLIALRSSDFPKEKGWLAKQEKQSALRKNAAEVSVQAISAALPLSFEANRGQSGDQVKFFSRGSGYRLFLASTELVLALRKAEGEVQSTEWENPRPSVLEHHATSGTDTMLRIKLSGAHAASQIIGLDALPGRIHYFLGNNPRDWRVNIPHYAKVKYEGIYPGIDLVFYGSQQQLEFDFIVAPGANPQAIALSFDLAEGGLGKPSLRIDTDGDLVVQTPSEEIRLHQPRIYQELDGTRRAIAGGYVLPAPSRDEADGQHTDEVGFHVVSYDAGKPLIIDPVLSYSTYLGGSVQDSAHGIAVDTAGNVYVAGQTESSNFPMTANVVQPQINYGPVQFSDAFVLKLNPAGNALIYATYLGGTASDEARSIAVDATGNAYVTGSTNSTDFPAAKRFHSETANENTFPSQDAFVTKLSPTGEVLVYSTYLGGSSLDGGYGIAVDASGSAYVTGSTISPDFPLMNPLQAESGGAFVTKLDPAGTALVYSTYLGHDLNDRGHSIAVDAAGSAYVTGQTAPVLIGVALSGRGTTPPPTNPTIQSQPAVPNFPLVNPAQGTYGGGGSDGFVAKINPAGTALVYSTYLGGSESDGGNGIAVDASGNAYVIGHSFSTFFPKNNSLPTRRDGCSTVDHLQANAFVMKLNPAGNAFVYTACLGNSVGQGIAIDAAGNAYVTGYTDATNFPTANPLQAAHRGGQFDAFVAKLNPAGSRLDFATYLGGSAEDLASGIALDRSGNLYVTGYTDSENFPLANPLQKQKMSQGTSDVFIAKISFK